MKKTLGYIMIMFLGLTVLPACSSKKDGKTTRVNRYSGGDYRNNPYQDPYNNTSPRGEWGVIYNNSQSMNNVLQTFMYGISDLGFVSGSPNASTGIRFRGQVTNQNGRIDLLVWDEEANRGMDPYYWSLQVVSMNEDNRGATIVVEDNVGIVTFQGNFINTEFRGRVTFDNNKTDGARDELGEFTIDTCALFLCN